MKPLWPDVPGGLALVSTSPRRAALLRSIGASFEIVPPRDGSEEGKEADAVLLAIRHAESKARSARAGEGPAVLLAADTVVEREGRILGKPESDDEAAAMLEFLGGGEHRVVTGVCALHRESGRAVSAAETTSVLFRDLAADEIAAYVATGEPRDKAGAYGIQGVGGLLVAGVRGCYFNVVGLPLVCCRRVLLDLLGGGGRELRP